MALTSYVYTKENVRLSKIRLEIKKSAISTSVAHMYVTNSESSDNLTIWMMDELSPTDKSILDIIVLGHTTTVSNFAGTERFARHNDISTQVIGSTPVTLEFDGGSHDELLFEYNSGEVVIMEAGLYIVTFTVSADVSGSTRSGGEHFLEHNNVLVPGSKSYTYHRMSSVGKDSATVRRIVDVADDDTVRVRSKRYVGSNLTTLTQGCSLSIERIT